MVWDKGSKCLKYVDVMERCISRGFNLDRINPCIEEYEELNVWQELTQVAKDNPCVHVIQLDVSNESEYDSLVSRVASVVGAEGLTILFNNAGVLQNRGSIEQVHKSTMMKHFEVNCVAPLMITKACLPLLRQAAAGVTGPALSHSRAAVFNMSSILGSITENTSGKLYPYRSTKAALNMLSMSLHRDLSPEGILCVSLHPGWVQTDMGGAHAPVTPQQSVAGLMSTMASVSAAHGGLLLDYKGNVLPW